MVDNFRFRCIKVLPTVYEDALSYYETLCKVSRKLNEVIDTLNEYDPESVVNRLIDSKLTAYTANVMAPYVTAAIGVVDREIAELWVKINQMERNIVDQHQIVLNMIGELNTRVDNLGIQLVGVESRCNEYTDRRVQDVLYELPLMASPYTGQMVTVIDAIYEVANNTRTGALTASEYDALELTATTYDALELSAYQYDWYGVTT